jgi:hypothetical protein
MKIFKAGECAALLVVLSLGIYAQTPAPSSPQSASTEPSTALSTSQPDGFVPYTEMKDQFTIALPSDWMVYDQGRLMGGSNGPFGMVIFLPTKEFKSDGGFASIEVIQKVSVGGVPSFFLQKNAADKGMSCAGFSEKDEKKLVKLIADDSVFKKGAKVTEAPHADHMTVAGCSGLRIRGSSQPSGGTPWTVDAYVASSKGILYIFSLRNKTENYAKNVDLFQKIVSTAKLTDAK